VITASTGELLGYLADVIAEAERYGATVLPPDDGDEVVWANDGDGLVMDVAPVDLVLQERWRPHGRDWLMAEYGYELRHHQLGFRRALHRHDEEYFVRTHGVATHEHCESTMGHETCGHYAGEPMRGALDGLMRLYSVWLTGRKPDCSTPRCLG
jgi:hypothetical protein